MVQAMSTTEIDFFYEEHQLFGTHGPSFVGGFHHNNTHNEKKKKKQETQTIACSIEKPKKSCLPKKVATRRDVARKLFFDTLVPSPATEVVEQHYEFLKTIVIMDHEVTAAKTMLRQFRGKLHDVDDLLIQELQNVMPDTIPARVADFNENISYSMLNNRGLLSLMLQEDSDDDDNNNDNQRHVKNLVANFETTLKQAVGNDDIQYQGSFLKTEEKTIPQPAHVDFTWEYLQQETDQLFIGFFPLSQDGMFLQFWQNNNSDNNEEQQGTILFLPLGKMLLVPADTVHGGGFRFDNKSHCNPRFHLYVASHGKELPAHQQNKYTERNDKRRELCDRLTDAAELPQLLDLFFD